MAGETARCSVCHRPMRYRNAVLQCPELCNQVESRALTPEQLTKLREVISKEHAIEGASPNARSKRIVAWYAGRSSDVPGTNIVLIQTVAARKFFADWQSQRPLYLRIMEWLAS